MYIRTEISNSEILNSRHFVHLASMGEYWNPMNQILIHENNLNRPLDIHSGHYPPTPLPWLRKNFWQKFKNREELRVIRGKEKTEKKEMSEKRRRKINRIKNGGNYPYLNLFPNKSNNPLLIVPVSVRIGASKAGAPISLNVQFLSLLKKLVFFLLRPVVRLKVRDRGL